jgi:CRP-like cAMP-binding protein
MIAKARTGRIDEGGHLDVLSAIPPEYRKAVLDQCVRKRYRKGQILWNQGDEAGYVGFLVEGMAMSTYHSPGGKIGTTGFWFAGDLLGAGDLWGSTTRQMTVRCLEDSVLYMLPIERIYEIVRRFPEVSEAIIKALSVRLRWVAHLALTLETQTAVERVCAVLLAVAERFGMEGEEGTLINLNLTHGDLAAMVGVSRQFMNITLHDLQRRELIRLKSRRIIVRDKKQLEALVHSP